MADPITLDPTTPIGAVRTLIRDKDPARPIFSDDEILLFLTLEDPSGQDRLTAAGHALLALANDKARLKLQKSDGGEETLDGMARALRQQAEIYFEKATSGAGWAVAENPDPPSWGS
jgi:hypothetical protein